MNKWQHIEESLKALRAADDRVLRLSQDIGLEVESPLIDCFNKAQDAALKSLAMLAGDRGDWVEWYFYDCECGKKPMEAGIDGDMRLIDSVEKLRWLIELKSEKG